MHFSERIKDIQQHLAEQKLDGWLLYDFHRTNTLAVDFLMISSDAGLTRRFFYWIPVKGNPIKIVHAIESQVLDHLPGEKREYFKWETLVAALADVLKGQRRVAMEYYPRGAIPYVSKVDGGIIDLVRSFKVDVETSALLLQIYTSCLDEAQLTSHKEAAQFLERTVLAVWDYISQQIARNTIVTEYSVQQFILEEFEKHGFVTDHAPICSCNVHSANPHYQPSAKQSLQIGKGDFILIDLWCKRPDPRAVFADITRVAVAADSPTEKQREVHQLVRLAQKAATDHLQAQLSQGKTVKGYECDKAARKVIEEAGYGNYFTHRTGHNIYTELHGPGTNLDSTETFDERPLIPRTCFSIEPGIYLPGQFGVRQEYDVYIGEDSRIQIHGGVQESVTALF